jgi:adenine-specific DNA-methyltransferase
MEQIEKVDLKSLQITEDIKAQLKTIMPQVFSEGKIDFEKLKLTLGEEISDSEERFGLQWPGKKDCFSVIQEPSIGTLKPCKEESVNWDTTENLFIEGDNLEVLKQLQKAYYGKVKMIYIDPPYNTGNDFVYKDSFGDNIKNYLELTGQTDEEGSKLSTNNETDGRFHSNWLNMMYPRLFLARNLLKSDGVIFISIDDHEVHNLKEICNEIFGEESFVAQLVWQRAYSPVNLKKTFSENHDYILCYSKNINNVDIKGLKRSEAANNRYKNYDNDPRGLWKSSDLSVGPAIESKVYEITTPSGRKVLPPNGYCWRLTKERFEEFVTDSRIWFGNDGNNVPSIKRFLSEVGDRITPMTLWTREEVGDSQEGMKELKKLFNDKAYFDYPKPVRLMQRIIELTTDSDDLILDFFAGSSSMAHGVIAQNKVDNGKRKFIMVQLPEAVSQKTEAYKDGYKIISQISRARIKKALIMNNSEEGFKAYKLSQSNFKIWKGDIENQGLNNLLEKALFHINIDSSEEDILSEILLKSGFELTVKTEEILLLKKKIYSVSDGALLICLEKELSIDLITQIAKLEPARVVCLDSGFNEKDDLKTNAIQIMKSHGIDDFRTV